MVVSKKRRKVSKRKVSKRKVSKRIKRISTRKKNILRKNFSKRKKKTKIKRRLRGGRPWRGDGWGLHPTKWDGKLGGITSVSVIPPTREAVAWHLRNATDREKNRLFCTIQVQQVPMEPSVKYYTDFEELRDALSEDLKSEVEKQRLYRFPGKIGRFLTGVQSHSIDALKERWQLLPEWLVAVLKVLESDEKAGGRPSNYVGDQETVVAWLNSSAHRRRLVDPAYEAPPSESAPEPTPEDPGSPFVIATKVALYPFDARGVGAAERRWGWGSRLPLLEGDTVYVTNKTSSDWWRGFTKTDGVRSDIGYFPSDFVEDLHPRQSPDVAAEPSVQEEEEEEEEEDFDITLEPGMYKYMGGYLDSKGVGIYELAEKVTLPRVSEWPRKLEEVQLFVYPPDPKSIDPRSGEPPPEAPEEFMVEVNAGRRVDRILNFLGPPPELGYTHRKQFLQEGGTISGFVDFLKMWLIARGASRLEGAAVKYVPFAPNPAVPTAEEFRIWKIYKRGDVHETTEIRGRGGPFIYRVIGKMEDETAPDGANVRTLRRSRKWLGWRRKGGKGWWDSWLSHLSLLNNVKQTFPDHEDRWTYHPLHELWFKVVSIFYDYDDEKQQGERFDPWVEELKKQVSAPTVKVHYTKRIPRRQAATYTIMTEIRGFELRSGLTWEGLKDFIEEIKLAAPWPGRDPEDLLGPSPPDHPILECARNCDDRQKADAAQSFFDRMIVWVMFFRGEDIPQLLQLWNGLPA